MSHRWFSVGLVVLAGALPMMGRAQPVPVYVESVVGENDSVGRTFVFHVRERVRRSAAFRAIEDSKRWPYVKLSLITVRGDAGNNSTAVGYAITLDAIDLPLSGALITAGVHSCGISKLEQCATSMAATLDESVRQARKDAPALFTRLFP